MDDITNVNMDDIHKNPRTTTRRDNNYESKHLQERLQAIHDQAPSLQYVRANGTAIGRVANLSTIVVVRRRRRRRGSS